MPYYRHDSQFSYAGNFNWTKRSHEKCFGGELYYTGMNQLQREATGSLYGAQGGFGFRNQSDASRGRRRLPIPVCYDKEVPRPRTCPIVRPVSTWSQLPDWR
jgi:hypothetical protein